MKFRCTSNSIRFRVRKSDIELLRKVGEISDQVQFGGGQVFGYALRQGAYAELGASFESGQILVRIPVAQATAWMDSEEVGISGVIPFGDGQTLQILIEKDFPCRHTSEQNRQDTYFELAPEDPSVC